MIAVDTNVLVHAHQREASLHDRAKAKIRQLAEASRPWAVCCHALVEFYAVVTHNRTWREPSTPEQAWDQVVAWGESPSLRILGDDPRMIPLLGRFAVDGRVRGGMVHDARIATCCLHHGVTELWTVDRDFSRFPGLRTRNPLA